MKLLPAVVLMAIFLAFSASVAVCARAEPFEVIGSVSSHPVLLAGETRLIDGLDDVGAQLEITTTQNVLDPDVGMLLYSGNPVGNDPAGMAPLGRYVSISISDEAAGNLKRLAITMPYYSTELRASKIEPGTLVIYLWNGVVWKRLPTKADFVNGMLTAETRSLGIFSIYGAKNVTENESAGYKCSSSSACSDWSVCSSGWHNRTCHGLDTCTGERSDIVETEECSSTTPDNSDSSITGMLAGRGDAMIMLSILAVVFILAAIVELKRGK